MSARAARWVVSGGRAGEPWPDRSSRAPARKVAAPLARWPVNVVRGPLPGRRPMPFTLMERLETKNWRRQPGQFAAAACVELAKRELAPTDKYLQKPGGVLIVTDGRDLYNRQPARATCWSRNKRRWPPIGSGGNVRAPPARRALIDTDADAEEQSRAGRWRFLPAEHTVSTTKRQPVTGERIGGMNRPTRDDIRAAVTAGRDDRGSGGRLVVLSSSGPACASIWTGWTNSSSCPRASTRSHRRGADHPVQ